jgi:hypothetical protein
MVGSEGTQCGIAYMSVCVCVCVCACVCTCTFNPPAHRHSRAAHENARDVLMSIATLGHSDGDVQQRYLVASLDGRADVETERVVAVHLWVGEAGEGGQGCWRRVQMNHP